MSGHPHICIDSTMLRKKKKKKKNNNNDIQKVARVLPPYAI
jgi:hypothetical protein